MSAVGYYIFYGLTWIITLLPLPVLYIFSDITWFFAYYIFRYRRKVAFTNLHNAFPGKENREIRRIARRFYLHYCDEFVETMALIHMSPDEIKRRLTYLNPEVMHNLYEKGKSVIGVIGHYGNWEWLASLPLTFRYQACGIYKPLNDKRFDRLFIRMREKFGVVTIPMDLSLKKMLEFHKSGIRTITLFLTDQRPIRRNIRYWTTFLNQDTPVLLGTERIGKKTNQAIVFFNLQKLRRGYYQVEFIPLFENPQEARPYEITEKHVQVLEDIIRKNPEYWLWSHRRWRHNKKKWMKWAEDHNIEWEEKPHE
jgi:KDO2-lipid IV(A) lauroyltransferase